MVSPLFFYQLVLVALVWLCIMLHWAWPSDPATACPTTREPTPPRPKRKQEPTPFAGLTTKPPCNACEHPTDSRPQAPSAPPPRLVPTRGRRRERNPPRLSRKKPGSTSTSSNCVRIGIACRRVSNIIV
jgi:hypothetical protein